jgi:hypothetical protein
MTGDDDIETAFTPEAFTPEEQSFAEQLANQRPVPAAGFRGTLGRHLAAIDPGHGPRPERLRSMVLAYIAAGVLLMALGALQATGVL